MPLVHVLVFLSGLSSLVYEIAWIRRASLVFGSSALALSTVLAVFFLGLGLGSALFGRIGGRSLRPLLWCAALEILLAVNGLVSEALFTGAEAVYGEVYRRYDPGSGMLLALRGGLVAALLLPPTLLMGGTLPLFCRLALRDPARLAGQLGRLYGINTLGAAVGCCAAGFLLLPHFGLSWALRCAAALNLVAGLGFWRLDTRLGPLPAPAEDAPAIRKDRPKRLAGLLFFMVGAAALANELLWARFLTYFIRNSVYTYTLALAVVLVGMAAGSLWLGPRGDRARHPQSLLAGFAALQAGSAALTLALTHLPAGLWRAAQPWGVLPFGLLMLPPALVAGACFPLLVRGAASGPERSAQEVGQLAALNILGGIAGSLLTGYWLLPHYGLDVGLFASAGWSLAAAGLALGAGAGRWRPSRTFAAPAWVYGGLLVWAGLLAFPPLRIPRDLLPQEALLDWTEGYNSTLAVSVRRQAKTLLIDRLWQGTERRNYQIMVAHIPMLHHPDAKDVLVVGLGAGTTASRFLSYPIRRLDIVDIEPKLFGFVRRHFPSAWMDDPRTQLLPEDGRNVLRHGVQPYDLISVEIGQPDRPGVGALYTREFYREAAARLRPDGVMTQFVPLRYLRPGDLASILKTFLAEFPAASLWYNTDELLLLGFKGEARRLSPQRYADTLTKPGLRADLDFNYWGGPAYSMNRFPAFLGGFLASGPELAALAAAVPAEPFSDDRQQLSYRVSGYRREEQRALALVPLLRAHLSPLEQAVAEGSVNPALLKTAARVREDNVSDIAASDHLGLLDTAPEPPGPERVLERAAEALRWNPRNVDAQRRFQAARTSLDAAAAEAKE